MEPLPWLFWSSLEPLWLPLELLQGRRFFSGAPLASLRNENFIWRPFWLSWSGGSLRAPLAPLGAASSKPLWLLLERRLLLELF